MDARVVGSFHLLESVAAMAGLTAGFASGFLTQAARGGFLQSVAGEESKRGQAYKLNIEGCRNF